MSVQAITSSKMASKVDETERPILMKIKPDASSVSQRRGIEIVVATLCVIVQIIVFVLKKWTRLVRDKVRGSYDNLLVALSKMTVRLVNAVLTVGEILGILIGELSDTINELSGADLVAAISDVVRYLETGPDDEESLARGSKATVAVKWQETTGYVLGEPSNNQQKQAWLSLKNNSLRRGSDVRQTILQRQCSSRLANKQTTNEREEKPERNEEIILDTPQPTVLKIDNVTYETLPSDAAGPVASFRPEKMAEWRRDKFFTDVTPAVTAEITDAPAYSYGNRKWRYFTRPREGRLRTRRLVKTRPIARNDDAPRPRVPHNGVTSTAVPPTPSGPGRLAHGHQELLADPPQPGSVPLSHGYQGLFTGPPSPGFVSLSHGHQGPFAGLSPPNSVCLSHGHHGPFMGPPPPRPVLLSDGRPGPFAGPPQPGSMPLSHGYHGPFASPPPLGPLPFSHGHHGPFAGPSSPSPVPFSQGRTGSFVGPTATGPIPFSHGRPGPFADTRRFPYRSPGPFADPSTHIGSM